MCADSKSMLSSVERVNRRQQIRLKACVPGRFSLADYRDGRGNRRRFACRAIELAETTITCTTAISGRLGDRVIAYFQEFGKFHGPIVQVADEGFVMRIVATDQHGRDGGVPWLGLSRASCSIGRIGAGTSG